MDRVLRVAALASSLRDGSYNRQLVDAAAASLDSVEGDAVEVDVIDLRTLPLPLFDADLQERDGVPVPAQEIHDRVAASDALLVANPEYNGGYPALFKNVVDWVSRIDMFVFHPRYVGLLSATPGKGGGARGVEHTRALLQNIFVTAHDEPFLLPKADAAFADGVLDGEESVRLDEWSAGFAAGARAHVKQREDAAGG